MDFISIAALFLSVVAVILLIVLLVRQNSAKPQDNTEEIANIRRDIASVKAVSENGLNTIHKTIADGNLRLQNAVNEGNAKLLETELNQQNKLFETLGRQNESTMKTLHDSLDKMNSTMSGSIEKLQQSNEQKLDEMRKTVDEKMQKTLNERLDSSFKTVSEQLEKLYESLGKMKNLSDGVNDLQRLLTNVKARGTWAEVQLGEILEQFLTADQYDVNVSTKSNNERVEFAVKIPSRDNDGTFVWLPIDSKFPQEDYLRLQAAADRCDKIAVEESEKALAKIIKDEAATISRLYINVPKTTNFAIMFLPTEGLYAEVLRQNGLVEEIQRKYSVMICGPTTISAFLNTLRVGFRTIAIDKQQAEVWKILGAAKQQYATFETVLEKAEKKINEAGNVLSDARKRNGIIQRKLNKVEDISQADSNEILGIEEG